MSIKKMIYGMLATLIVLSLLSTATTFWELNQNQDNGRVVNYTGKIRGTGQRMVKLYLLDQNVDKQKENVTNIIHALLKGDKELNIPVPIDKEFIQKIMAVQTYWNESMLPLFGTGKPIDKKLMLEATEEFYTLTDQAVDSAEEFSSKDIVTLKIMVMITCLLMLITILIIAVVIQKKILAPIKELELSMNNFSKGNLNTKISFHSNNELGALANSIEESISMIYIYINEIGNATKQMADGNLNLVFEKPFIGDFHSIETAIMELNFELTNTLGQIGAAAKQVSSGANQVSDGAQALAQGATEQANSATELSLSINDISEKVNQNANNASKANHMANLASDALAKSNEQMKKLMGAMTEMNNKSVQISKIIKVIEDIAFQTNILALNAAVEAARAGSAGKGFAVVADEVRSLAGKSAEAARNTTELIESSVISINSGVKLASQTAIDMQNVVESANAAADMIDKISLATKEQSSSISQVSMRIEQISSVIQTNSATSEENAASSEELSGQANIMKQLISKFNLSYM